jgi:hypothetical protein
MLGSNCSPCCSRNCAPCGDLLIVQPQYKFEIASSYRQAPVGPSFQNRTLTDTRIQRLVGFFGEYDAATVSDSLTLTYNNCVYLMEYSATVNWTEAQNAIDGSDFQTAEARTSVVTSGEQVRVIWEFASLESLFDPSRGVDAPQDSYSVECSAEWDIPFCSFDDPDRYQVGSGNPTSAQRFPINTISGPYEPGHPLYPYWSQSEFLPTVQATSRIHHQYVYNQFSQSWTYSPKTLSPNLRNCLYPNIYFLESWNPSCGPSPCNPLP